MENRFKFVMDLKEQILNSLSPSQVISKYIELIPQAGTFKGLCPFHNDHTYGSFFVTDSKNIWKCFSCGKGGNAISFVAQYKNISYFNSILEIAFDHGFISMSEYQEAMQGKVPQKEEAKIKCEVKKDYEKRIKSRPIASINILNRIYHIFIKSVIEADNLQEKGKYGLTLQHYKHLKDVRGLSDNEIIKGKYFSFPKRMKKAYIKTFYSNLEKEHIKKKTLQNIPGFFFDKEKNQFTFTSIKGGGIGIPILNIDGLIQGIQIRRDEIKEKQCRYIWFSSDFVNNDNKKYENYDMGSSPGTPIDVVYPGQFLKNNKPVTSVIFVTEGRFKAEAIAKNYNSIALSLQGVNTWRKVIKILKSLQCKYPNLNLNRIFITFDADMGYNLGVAKQAIKMGQTLTKEFKSNVKDSIWYVVWNDDDGKGIDDLIINKNDDKKYKISLSNMENRYNIYIDELNTALKKSNEKKIEELPKSVRKTVYIQQILQWIKYISYHEEQSKKRLYSKKVM